MASILVVDDSALARRLVRAAFEAAGHEVVEAENGRQAFSRLRERPEIALVLTDLNMPGIGGMALLARIRQEECWATLPIILVTAEVDPALVQRAKTLGASGWAVKPCKPARLVEMAESLLPASCEGVRAVTSAAGQ